MLTNSCLLPTHGEVVAQSNTYNLQQLLVSNSIDKTQRWREPPCLS